MKHYVYNFRKKIKLSNKMFHYIITKFNLQTYQSDYKFNKYNFHLHNYLTKYSIANY